MEEIQTTWNEQSLKSFLEEKARFLSENIGRGRCYDGLILVISCHGISGFLCTSDYRLYSKFAIHRTFSMFAILREIPRFILYDCCQGADSIEKKMDDYDSELELAKNLSAATSYTSLQSLSPTSLSPQSTATDAPIVSS